VAELGGVGENVEEAPEDEEADAQEAAEEDEGTPQWEESAIGGTAWEEANISPAE
jgi:hypothetical protein